MPLKPRFNKADIDAELARMKAKVDQVIQNEVVALGFRAANHAREQRGYTDRTGNLVNSTGFIVLKDGVDIFENFVETYRGAETVKDENGQVIPKNGLEVGRDYAGEIAADFRSTKGWVLIVVAGMEYASNVEKEHGRNVLGATELFIKSEWPKMIQRLVTVINNANL